MIQVCFTSLRIIIHLYTIGGILNFLIPHKRYKIRIFEKFYLRNLGGILNRLKIKKTL